MKKLWYYYGQPALIAVLVVGAIGGLCFCIVAADRYIKAQNHDNYTAWCKLTGNPHGLTEKEYLSIDVSKFDQGKDGIK